MSDSIIGSGMTAAQFFARTGSLVCDMYPLQTDKQFVNVLQDNIQKWGAITELVDMCNALFFQHLQQVITAGYIKFKYLPTADTLSKLWFYVDKWLTLQCL